MISATLQKLRKRKEIGVKLQVNKNLKSTNPIEIKFNLDKHMIPLGYL